MNSLIELATIIQRLNEKWTPHGLQVEIGRALFYEEIKNIFVCAARNLGKTELAAYASWRWALENPGSENYIIEPFLKQAREILWAGRRLQLFGPQEYIESINNSELRIRFKNGSFIKLEGSDNEVALAGIKPKGLIIYDEVKDHRKSAIQNMEPNRAAFDAPALFIGSPPEFHCYYVELMELAKKSSDWRYFHGPTSANPHISPAWLERKKKELHEMGEDETWLRDYEGIYVKGGKRSIFPQFLKLSFSPLSVPEDLNKWTLFITFDPAASSTFGVLFALFNPYTKKIIIFDEIYESNPAEMTARKMFEKVEAKIEWLRLDPILKIKRIREMRWIYDEAARYFASEIAEVSSLKSSETGKEYKNDWELEPSRKAAVGVHGYVSIVRSVLNQGLVTVTDNCRNFISEMEGYVKDENGHIPKEKDHLINCFQYKLQAMGFNLDESTPPKEVDLFEQRRAIGMEAEIFKDNKLVDFDDQIINHSFEEIE